MTKDNEEVISLKGLKFTVGMVCHGSIPPLTAISFIQSFRTCAASGIQLNLVSELYNSVIDSARNNAVQEFLKQPDANKLIFIDCDMTWTPEDLIRLMCWSTKYPIVGAMYSTKNDGPHKFLARYDLNNESGLVEENEYGLVKMQGIGTGFCIIDRSVFEKMMPSTEIYVNDPQHGETYRFFKTTTNDGRFVGEDIYFFQRWTKEFGGELWVDPDINPGHIGQKVYRGNLRYSLGEYNEQLAASKAAVNSEKEI